MRKKVVDFCVKVFKYISNPNNEIPTSMEVNLKNNEKMVLSFKKVVNPRSDKTIAISTTTKEENNTPETQCTLIKEENNTPETQITLIKEENNTPETQITLIKEEHNAPEIRSTITENDITDEQIDLLTSIYNGATSNDTKKLTIDDLKSIFACFSQDNTDEEYDIMMKILDSKNDDETGLDKFLTLFKSKSSQIESGEILSTRSSVNNYFIKLFQYFSNGKRYLNSGDINHMVKVINRVGMGCPEVNTFKKFCHAKGRITYDEFCAIFNN
ncbi:uncharacterized protein LOC126896441 isoform X2 [Daktulosphaira vitifoliae]|uniref:uncharacterized protein LOC126896441 isoform X2 n=1 Tax=Daktulosphaira vitifoliae TaxID=58002 RepID=UPI0021AA742B|nr:uncharacterized protein LOC126896441 isoform X2 [Daktulosphaira vitifoliae]